MVAACELPFLLYASADSRDERYDDEDEPDKQQDIHAILLFTFSSLEDVVTYDLLRPTTPNMRTRPTTAAAMPPKMYSIVF